MKRNHLFPEDLAEGDLAAFTALAADWPGLPVENVALEYAERSDVLAWQNKLRKFRTEAAASNDPKAAAALRVAARALQALGAELDARTEAGSPEPRATAGRKSAADSGDSPARPLATVGDALPGGSRPRAFGALFAPRAKGSNGGQFANLGEFVACALTNPLDSRLRAAVTTFGSEGVGADGGFAVPVQFIDALMDEALESEIVRPRAYVVPMASNTATLPAFDLSDGTGRKRANLQLKWRVEGGEGSNQKVKLRDVTMRAHYGYIDCPVTNEQVEDAIRYPERLQSIMAMAAAAGLDAAFVRGSGVGEPLGVLNSGGKITTAKVGGQTADTINLQNLIDMHENLSAESKRRRRAVWLASKSARKAIIRLAAETRNLAGSEVVGAGNSSIVRFENGVLSVCGLPVEETDLCNPIGDEGDLMLADFGRYLIGMRREVYLQTSIHAHWEQHMTAFRLVVRVDGQPELDRPVTLRDGTTQEAPFVTLEAR